jgi:hypothetical protein
LLRHHVGSVPFQLTCRDDRAGGNPGLPGKVDELIEKLEILRNNVSVGGSIREIHDITQNCIDKAEWLKDNADRYTPVNLGLLLNAQSLIDMAHLRLCYQAHKETIEVFQQLKAKINEVDSALASMMVPKCVYRNGLCGEPRCCGFNHTPKFKQELEEYLQQYTLKQRGITNEKSN